MANKDVIAVATREEYAALCRADGARIIMNEFINANNLVRIGMIAQGVFNVHQEMFENILKSHGLPIDRDYSIDASTEEITICKDDEPDIDSVKEFFEHLTKDKRG